MNNYPTFDYPTECRWCEGTMSSVDPLDSGPAVCCYCGAEAEFDHKNCTFSQPAYTWTMPRKAFETMARQVAEAWDRLDDGDRYDWLTILEDQITSIRTTPAGKAVA